MPWRIYRSRYFFTLNIQGVRNVLGHLYIFAAIYFDRVDTSFDVFFKNVKQCFMLDQIILRMLPNQCVWPLQIFWGVSVLFRHPVSFNQLSLFYSSFCYLSSQKACFSISLNTSRANIQSFCTHHLNFVKLNESYPLVYTHFLICFVMGLQVYCYM